MALLPDHRGGVLPPFSGEHATRPAERAPYQTDTVTVAARFGHSAARVKLLRGLFDLRGELRAHGIRGFQWIDGSFVDHMRREPNDIDLITFVEVADQADFARQNRLMDEHPALFIPDRAKERFGCHSFYVRLWGPHRNLVSLTHYWYGLFAHDRTGRWRGFVQVPLDDSDDGEAERMLALGTLSR